MAEQRNPHEKIPRATWAKIKTLWESDSGTFPELSERFKIPVQTIKHRSSKYKWVAHRLAGKVEQKAAESTVEMLARLKMPKERVLELLVERAQRCKDLKNIKEIAKGKDGKILYQPNGRPLIIERTVEVNDNEIQFRNLQEIIRLANWQPAPKAAVDEPDAPDEPIPHVMDIPKPDPQPPQQPQTPAPSNVQNSN